MGEHIVLAGGSGFLGQHFAKLLISHGYEVVILSRKPSTTTQGIKYVQWDGKTLGDWAKEIDGAHAVVNFTGKSVNCIYTKANKEEIISSRVNSVKVMREAIKQSANPPKVSIQSGSLAFFGSTKDLCNEDTPHGEGFSADVCVKWETEFYRERLANTRQVLLRIGIVLGEDGGALEPFKNLAKYHLGGTLGSGKQYVSWIHIDDLNRMLLRAIKDEQIEGIYNATSPTPITNKEFMKVIRTTMGKGWAPPAPTPFIWLGAYLIMRADPSLALTSQRAVPKRFLDQGFQFQYADLKQALQDLI